MPVSTDALAADPSYHPRVTTLDIPYSPHYSTPYRGFTRGSYSTLNESLFSSKCSSSYDTWTREPNASPPPSPQLMLRRKPPPKPPRMRSYYSGTVRHLSSCEEQLSSRCLTPPPSVRSGDLISLKSSIADVTQALDATLSRSFDADEYFDGSWDVRSCPSPSSPAPVSRHDDKVYSILAQTRELLAFELEPLCILEYLENEAVISREKEIAIRDLRSKKDMCVMLLDIITSQGHNAFVIFCDALRMVGNQGYLADFLEALDSLVEIATQNTMKPVQVENKPAELTYKAFAFESHATGCACGSGVSDNGLFTDDSSFDISVCYVHRESGLMRSIQEVAGMKRRKQPMSPQVEVTPNVLLDEAENYLPMISLALHGQCLKYGGMDTIANILESYPCIRELSLSKNHLDSVCISRMGDALRRNSGLVKLDVRLNAIGDDGATAIANGIGVHTTLRVLNVSSTEMTPNGCASLLSSLSKNDSLVELDLGFNDMDDTSCTVLAEALAANCPLRKLRLRSCAIREYGARSIFRALKKNAKLYFLDISGNPVKDESLGVFSDILRCNRTLRELYIENCQIGPEGCGALSRALKSNTCLRHVDLSLNPQVADSGLEALSEGLKYNSSLQTLCVNMCNVGNMGFSGLLDALHYNTTITTIKLCYNKIGQPQPGGDSPPEQSASLPGHSRFPNVYSPQYQARQNRLGGGEPPEDESSEPAINQLYYNLCQVLQLNKDLKVLLWGNNFDEAADEANRPHNSGSLYNTSALRSTSGLQ